jgi:hypothetical protein
MTTRTQVLVALGIAVVLAGTTAWLLLDVNVSVAVWMAGPYFLLWFVLPRSADILATLVVVIAAYYFVSSLVALKYFSRRTLVLVVLVVISLNTLGAYAFHRLSEQSASADGRTAQRVLERSSPCSEATPRGAAVQSW